MERMIELPIAGHLTESDAARLEALGVDVDLFHQVPLAGPMDPQQLLRLAERLPSTIDFLRKLRLAGPITAQELESFDRIGLDRVLSVRRSIAGPATAVEVLRAAGGDA
ncbi:MAG: hypothetical protein ACRDZV_10875 [Acidimicrobiia bacterium]